MNKLVYILRGIPGAGKSFLAEELVKNNKSSIVCCADDYFLIDGKYLWTYEGLYAAHLYCQSKFKKALADNLELIIVSNTSTKEKRC
jgi:predicted ATPase